MKPIRQGDVLLKLVEDPEVARVVKRNGKNVPRVRGKGLVIAEGEATGHHHRISTKGVKLVNRGGTLYLIVPKSGAELVHEEHETLQVPQGTYKVDGQREYVPPVAQRQAPRQTRVYD